MMDFYTRIKFIIPDHRDNLDSLEHKLKLERDGILPRQYSSIHSTESSGQSGCPKHFTWGSGLLHHMARVLVPLGKLPVLLLTVMLLV
jgi:hypothetical protein